MRRIAVVDAPSNLGLRPPTAGSVPGCAKGPGALRDHGLLPRLGARDAGCLTPPRYDLADWCPGDGVAHAAAIATYSARLADRIGSIIDAGQFPLVLGGDCSVVIGSALAMRRRSAPPATRIGLVYVDGHSDFRHPGNASYVGAAAGEGLALVTGRGQPDLAAIEHRRPYFRDADVVLVGIRTHDDYRLDLEAAGIAALPVPRLRAEGAARSAQWVRGQLADCIGYWVHVDVDVLDPAVMPAVDAPDPGGIAYTELELLIAGLVGAEQCLGMEITVFDPDYDPDGTHARALVDSLVAGLRPLLVQDVVPRQPTGPRRQVEPPAPFTPVEPAERVEPFALAETSAPVEVSVPAEPSGSAELSALADLSVSAEPFAPVEQPASGDALGPVDSSASMGLAAPIEPAAPVETVVPVEPAAPTEPLAVVRAIPVEVPAARRPADPPLLAPPAASAGAG